MPMDSPDIRFSIAIIHRNGADRLMEVMDAAGSALDPQRDELLVVDNGSTDDSVARIQAQYPGIILIANGCNNGFARACNQAITRARGEFVLLLNNDAFLEPDALDRFEQDFLTHSRAAIIAGQLYGADGQPQRSSGLVPTVWSEMGLVRRKAAPMAPAVVSEVETVVGACMAVRQEAIKQAGALDEDFFFYYEETEWCARLRRNGWKVLLDTNIRVTHLKGESTRPLRREAQLEMFRSRLLFYEKVFSHTSAIWMTVWRVLRLALNAALNGCAVILTLGLLPKLRFKAGIYMTQLAWLIAGRPEEWGLPDKCPRSGR